MSGVMADDVDALTIKSRILAADTAALAGDHATALEYAESAERLLAGLPDSRFGETEMKWMRDAIARVIDRVEKRVSASTGIQVQKRTYVNVTD